MQERKANRDQQHMRSYHWLLRNPGTFWITRDSKRERFTKWNQRHRRQSKNQCQGVPSRAGEPGERVPLRVEGALLDGPHSRSPSKSRFLLSTLSRRQKHQPPRRKKQRVAWTSRQSKKSQVRQARPPEEVHPHRTVGQKGNGAEAPTRSQGPPEDEEKAAEQSVSCLLASTPRDAINR